MNECHIECQDPCLLLERTQESMPEHWPKKPTSIQPKRQENEDPFDPSWAPENLKVDTGTPSQMCNYPCQANETAQEGDQGKASHVAKPVHVSGGQAKCKQVHCDQRKAEDSHQGTKQQCPWNRCPQQAQPSQGRKPKDEESRKHGRHQQIRNRWWSVSWPATRMPWSENKCHCWDPKVCRQPVVQRQKAECDHHPSRPSTQTHHRSYHQGMGVAESYDPWQRIDTEVPSVSCTGLPAGRSRAET